MAPSFVYYLHLTSYSPAGGGCCSSWFMKHAPVLRMKTHIGFWTTIFQSILTDRPTNRPGTMHGVLGAHHQIIRGSIISYTVTTVCWSEGHCSKGIHRRVIAFRRVIATLSLTLTLCMEQCIVHSEVGPMLCGNSGGCVETVLHEWYQPTHTLASLLVAISNGKPT